MTGSRSGLVESEAPGDVATTVARIAAALDARGLTLFAAIDHAAGPAPWGWSSRTRAVMGAQLLRCFLCSCGLAAPQDCGNNRKTSALPGGTGRGRLRDCC
jgi:hypothetical protein